MPSEHHDFDPEVLAARIVQAAVEDDPVRLHGAIEAALRLYPDTASDVFAHARQGAGAHGSACVSL